MSLNAYVTASGGEIGYAQAVQAGLMVSLFGRNEPHFTKPRDLPGDSQGCRKEAADYEQYFEVGWRTIQESLQYLAQNLIIVCEGAGSPAEINLKHRDLTNMRVAKYLNAPTCWWWILTGGAFAHGSGNTGALEPDEEP